MCKLCITQFLILIPFFLLCFNDMFLIVDNRFDSHGVMPDTSSPTDDGSRVVPISTGTAVKIGLSAIVTPEMLNRIPRKRSNVPVLDVV